MDPLLRDERLLEKLRLEDLDRARLVPGDGGQSLSSDDRVITDGRVGGWGNEHLINALYWGRTYNRNINNNPRRRPRTRNFLPKGTKADFVYTPQIYDPETAIPGNVDEVALNLGDFFKKRYTRRPGSQRRRRSSRKRRSRRHSRRRRKSRR